MSSYLAWAETMYGWVTQCLTSPSGLVYDHRGVDGSVDTAVWSYNQGAMIAAGAGLYRATGHRGYLRRARRLADAALASLARTGWANEPPAFVAIFFRDLHALDAPGRDRAFRQAEERYADARWSEYRDPATGLFGGTDPDLALLAQAGMTQLYADLASH